MVSWRSVRLIMLTLIFMGIVLVIGVIQLFNLSPSSLLAVIYSPRTLFTGSATTSLLSTPAIRTFEIVPPVLPNYPPVTIATSVDSIFAATVSTTDAIAARASAVGAPGIVGGGSCLQNPDHVPSILPDCVFNEQGQVVPSQE